MMENYKDLSELLESDSRAMAFYNSLPMSLQHKLYKGGVSTFCQLYGCAERYGCGKADGERNCILSAASANECTGLIGQGSDCTEDMWNSYSGIEPFGIPHE